jgi:hypothetical protein
MSCFVVLPIRDRGLDAKIREYASLDDATAYAEQIAARYPLVVVAEDFKNGNTMVLVKAFGTEATVEWQPGQWLNDLLSTSSGLCTGRILVLSERDAVALLEAIDNPSEPSESLQEIFRRHAELVKSSPEK